MTDWPRDPEIVKEQREALVATLQLLLGNETKEVRNDVLIRAFNIVAVPAPVWDLVIKHLSSIEENSVFLGSLAGSIHSEIRQAQQVLRER